MQASTLPMYPPNVFSALVPRVPEPGSTHDRQTHQDLTTVDDEPLGCPSDVEAVRVGFVPDFYEPLRAIDETMPKNAVPGRPL